jgi:hypothetical protein
VGGLAIGAIIGSRAYCPPPTRRVVERVYVYDCGYCDGYYRDYNVYSTHLVRVHDVDRCDLAEYYPPHHGGYWEEY